MAVAMAFPSILVFSSCLSRFRIFVRRSVNKVWDDVDVDADERLVLYSWESAVSRLPPRAAFAGLNSTDWMLLKAPKRRIKHIRNISISRALFNVLSR